MLLSSATAVPVLSVLNRSHGLIGPTSALACCLALTLIHLMIVSQMYRIIIINVYPLLLETPTTVLVEVGSLANADASVDTAAAADEVQAEYTYLVASTETLAAADLNLDYSAASFVPLSEILAKSAAASTRLSRMADAASIHRYRSVHHR